MGFYPSQPYISAGITYVTCHHLFLLSVLPVEAGVERPTASPNKHPPLHIMVHTEFFQHRFKKRIFCFHCQSVKKRHSQINILNIKTPSFSPPLKQIQYVCILGICFERRHIKTLMDTPPRRKNEASLTLDCSFNITISFTVQQS
jgi:hypothetical protein